MDFTNEYENLDPPLDASAAEPESNNEDPSPLLPPCSPKKRNSGRTGPTSIHGKIRSAKNAIKHGSCAETLILPTESEAGFHRLLGRWVKQYMPIVANPAALQKPCTAPDYETGHCPATGNPVCACAFDDALAYDFVLRVAQAEWQRIRCQRNHDAYLATIGGASPFNWSPEEIKKHDLNLRYKTSAERNFQREFRLLEQFLKSHQPKPAPLVVAAPPETKAEPEEIPLIGIVVPDANSPTGYSMACEIPPRKGVTCPYPCPAPANLPGHVNDKKESHDNSLK